MNILQLLPLLAAIKPLIEVGGPITSWAVSLILIGIIFAVVIWGCRKVLGPATPPPPPWNWIIWTVIALAMIFFLFSALGIGMP